MDALALTIAIPLIANLLFRYKICAFLASAPLGVFILWAQMVHLESSAPDSDFDGIFGMFCVVWAAVLICGYAVLFMALALVEYLIRRCIRFARRSSVGDSGGASEETRE